MTPAPLKAATWQTVSQALLEHRALDVSYLSRSAAEEKQFTLHPQGLVSRHSVTYLLATVNDYTDIRQFALHRLEAVTLSDTPWRESTSFDLDAYIRSGAFGYLEGNEDAQLIANVAPQVAWLLAETPLATQQSLTPLAESDWQRLEATVPNDQQTLWWLMGMGSNVEVLEPERWRDDIIETAREILARAE